MKALKLIALGYAIKTVIVLVAWAVQPDLPQRTAETARKVWERVWGEEAVR